MLLNEWPPSDAVCSILDGTSPVSSVNRFLTSLEHETQRRGGSSLAHSRKVNTVHFILQIPQCPCSLERNRWGRNFYRIKKKNITLDNNKRNVDKLVKPKNHVGRLCNSLVWPSFTLLIRWWPLVAVVNITAAKEEVICSRVRSNKVCREVDGWVKTSTELWPRTPLVICQSNSVKAHSSSTINMFSLHCFQLSMCQQRWSHSVLSLYTASKLILGSDVVNIVISAPADIKL